ncbi:Eukaryotic translation initiation factor 2D [Blattella germanica]|nr:Eukaryotic translation initiation factor 2D [Blattella germanica]
MFLKPFKVKSNTLLRGSERKRIKSLLMKAFPHLTENQVDEILPPKESLSVVKLITHGGTLVLVYVVNKDPVVFDVEDVLFPTVYTLWKLPHLLPVFTTWPAVIQKLAGGADLMLPGIVIKGDITVNSYGTLNKGDTVAINATNNTAPVAVGTANLSSQDMYMAGQHGKAVKVVHVVGDNLWAMGTKYQVPDLGLEVHSDVEKMSPGPSTDDLNDGSLAEVLEGKCKSLTSDIADLKIEDSNDEEAQTALKLQETEELRSESPLVDPQVEMNELLEFCLIKACKTTAKKADLPLLTSNFYKVHMIPACPPGATLDIKKSSYKKLSRFLQEMERQDVLKVKELTKGVESITAFNFSHQRMKDFVDIEPPKPMDSCIANKPAITELFQVTGHVLPVLNFFGLRKGDMLSATEVRGYVTEYVRKQNLQDAIVRNVVRLDGALQRVVQNPSIKEITWEELMSSFISKMSSAYQMSVGGERAVAHKGKLEPIDMQIGKRTGNKKVTLINNLELYGINIQEFAKECQHGVAASTSISTVAGKKSQQLLVQGNQVLFVGNLLMGKYQIPKRYIRGLEFAPKTKK